MTHRIILEMSQYSDNAFLTLTYSEEQLPKGGSLEPRHLQLFFKKLRKVVEPSRIRFFAVGEYGTRTQRPHYHCALFNYPSCFKPYSPKSGHCNCAACAGILESWRADDGASRKKGPIRGNITLGKLEPASAAYVAKYATKSMQKGDHDVPVPSGCIPPFSRQSLRPGLGEGVCDDIASAILFAERDGERPTDRERLERIPDYLSHGKLRRPIGRYLRGKIRARLGIEKETATRVAYEHIDEEMSDVRESALNAPPGQRATAFRELLIQKEAQRRLQVETKAKIKQAVKKL